MTQKPSAVISKLMPRHTKAGIIVCYDDHCVRLVANKETLAIDAEGVKVMAAWTGPVTLEQMVEVADKWLAQQKDGAE